MIATLLRNCGTLAALCVLTFLSGCAGRSDVIQPNIPGFDPRSAINVLDFGATGNGTTDDTDAFHAALAKIRDMEGGVLFIPTGNYLVGDLVVPSETRVQGETAGPPRLLMRPGSTNLFRVAPTEDSSGNVTPPHDIQFDSLVLRGRSDIDGFSETHHLLRIIGVSRVKISHVSFQAFQGDGLYVGTNGTGQPNNHNIDVTVSNSTFNGVNHQNRNGISFIDCRRCIVENNAFQGVGSLNMPGSIDIEPNHPYEIIDGIVIRDNTIEDTTGHVGAISVVLGFKNFAFSPSGVVIDHNLIDQTINGVFVRWSGLASDAPAPLQMSIQNNTIRHAQHGIVLDGVAGVEVTRNVVHVASREVLIGQEFGARDLTFRSNQFIQVGTGGGKGMVINGLVANITFERNLFVDVGAGRAAGVVTYFAQGSSSDIHFIQNTYRSPQRITRLAVDSASGFLFNPTSNIWQDNVLMDGIQAGTFPTK